MSLLFRSTAICAILAGAPALALTPDEAWKGWQAQIKAMGLPVSAEATPDGDALQIGTMSIQIDFPKVKGYITLPGPRLEPGQGGAVNVIYPTPYTVTLGGEAEGEGKFDATLEGELMGQTAVMTGDPSRTVTDWAHQGMTFTLKSLTVDGQPADNATATLKMLAGKVNSVAEYGSDSINVTSTNEMQGYSMFYTLAIPGEEGGKVQADSNSGPTTAVTKMILPSEGINWLASQDQLRDGRLGIDMQYKAASVTSSQMMDMGADGKMNQLSSVEDYDLFAKLSADGLSYGGTTGNFGFNIESAEIPFPIGMRGDGVEMGLGVPLLQSDEAQPMNLTVVLKDFTMNDEIWNLFDPGQGLPRDPANFALRADGTMILNFDLLNIQKMMDEGGPQGMPALPVNVNVSELLLAAAGASLNGDATISFKGMPDIMMSDIPVNEGLVNLTLTGANALIDKLVGLGLMSQEDAMGARMMSGMILKPGEGDDVLTSTIEIKPDGSVSANGQRLR
ncbi:hypothetical protein [Rhodalgimonas zhirmunskyi]|uniref:DUF2125 domain-containing protein n=1 Tax=Rhodalgimonas zhirmunskyi TaxID=2964767 RepID=A0AAJ1UEG2_9RHOB|nr:hypothetical protein [Rhodoalgimonas zhirmunskyi]MDQ2094527.1 hypothetical protein [Rhodoalgimonas zhirmunskyi]